MSEFNSRIAAQRKILGLVNSKLDKGEALLGLSHQAIQRWIATNRLDPKSNMVSLVQMVSAKLFFLANKSQEQISDDYKAITNEINTLLFALELEFRGI